MTSDTEHDVVSKVEHKVSDSYLQHITSEAFDDHDRPLSRHSQSSSFRSDISSVVDSRVSSASVTRDSMDNQFIPADPTSALDIPIEIRRSVNLWVVPFNF